MKKRAFTPDIETIIEEIKRISDKLELSPYLADYTTYNRNRPDGWSIGATILRKYGYSADAPGWAKMVHDHTGCEVLDRIRARMLRKRASYDLDVIADEIKRISQQDYGGQYAIGNEYWDFHRSPNLPRAKTILRHFDYPPGVEGWSKLVAEHCNMEVKPAYVVLIKKAAKKLALDEPVDSILDRDGELWQAVVCDRGLQICKETYLRTGRMILR